MLAQTYSLTHIGATTQAVTVETDVYNGLPGMSVVGLASKSIDEARDRIRSAIRNSGLEFPPRKVTINLAPADLLKSGTGYDLAIAVGLLIATKQIPQSDPTVCFIAELALNGSLRSTQNTYASVLAAQEAGFTTIVIDPDSAIDTSLCKDLTILRPASLRDLYLHLIGEKVLQPWQSTIKLPQTTPLQFPDLAGIQGLQDAKQALIIAAAGQHNLLLVGPPGAGKSLLASAIAGILPESSQAQRRSIHYVYSLAGEEPPQHLSHRPFRSPHHTSSTIAMTGGGAYPRPGEMSLAHHGVLFLDEIAEFSRTTLEALRQPLETGKIAIARAAQSVTFPAELTLIAAMNPCPCGYYRSEHPICTCSAQTIRRYQQKLSGPLLDRFDMVCWVNPPATPTVGNNVAINTSEFTRKLIQASQAISCSDTLDRPTQQLFENYLQKHGSSYRRQQKILQLARTVARLEGHRRIATHHLQQALYFQQSLWSEGSMSPSTLQKASISNEAIAATR